MAVTGNIQILPGSELEKLLTNRSTINVGEVLEGKVVQVQDDNRILVDFGRFRAVAQVNFPVQEGTVIPLTVTSKDGGQLSMKIAESLMAGVSQAGAKSFSFVSGTPVQGDDIEGFIQKVDKAVTKGEISTATDTAKPEVQNLSKADIQAAATNVKGGEVSEAAKTRVIPDNQQVQEQVQGKEAVNLKGEQVVAETRPVTQPDTRSTGIKIGAEVSELLKVVKEHFEPFDSKLLSDLPALASRLKRIVEKSGIFHGVNEDSTLTSQKIRNVVNQATGAEFLRADNIREPIDLKPVLNMLKERFDDIAAKAGENFKGDAVKIRNSIEILLYGIEAKQQEMLERKPAAARDDFSQQQIFTFALPFKETHHRGKLKVYLNKKSNKGKKGGYKVSLLLNMGNLGDIRSDFLMTGRRVAITLFVKSERIKEYILEYIDELEDLIEQIFRQQEIKVVVSPRNIKNFDSEDIDEEYHSSSLVDLKA